MYFDCACSCSLSITNNHFLKVHFSILSPGQHLSRLQSPIDVNICSLDQLEQRRGIDVTFGPEFHMAHERASAFQQTLGIRNLGSAKKSDIDVIFERIHIPE